MEQAVSKEQLEQFFEKNLPAYLEMLAQMVAINSFTITPDGIE
jgi:hypothetical protein